MPGFVIVNQPGVLLYDADGNPIATTDDGGEQKLETIAKQRNVAGTIVNPATQDTLATRASETTLASLDGKDFATETKLEAVRVLLNSLDGKDYATQTTLATLATETKLEAVRALLSTIDADTSNLDVASSTRASESTLAAVDAVLDSIKDTDGIKKITDQLPAGTNEIGKVAQGTKAAAADAWTQVLYDASGNPVTITQDAGVYRVEVQGKVTVVGASPPPSTTAATINADTPLTVGSHDTTFTIPNGETFYLQQLICGNEDPTKGASVEIIYDNGTEHLIARTFIAGFSISLGYSDVAKARDGTDLVGNGSHEIIVRRAKFSGSNIAIDAVVTGYTV